MQTNVKRLTWRKTPVQPPCYPRAPPCNPGPRFSDQVFAKKNIFLQFSQFCVIFGFCLNFCRDFMFLLTFVFFRVCLFFCRIGLRNCGVGSVFVILGRIWWFLWFWDGSGDFRAFRVHGGSVPSGSGGPQRIRPQRVRTIPQKGPRRVRPQLVRPRGSYQDHQIPKMAPIWTRK